MTKKNFIITVPLTIIFVVFFFPFFWIISSAFKSPQEIIQKNSTIIPNSFTFEHFNKILFLIINVN